VETSRYYNEWKKQFSVITSFSLEYVTVGGFAMIIHGLPRATVDLDIAIPARPEEIGKIEKIASTLEYKYDDALLEIGLRTPQYAIGQCLTLKDSDDIFHLDFFITSIEEFKVLKKDSETVDFEDIPITIASLKTIRMLKQKFNREIDKADIELIDKKLSDT